MVGTVVIGSSGCRGIVQMVRIAIALPWDKITTVVVNVLQGYVIITGFLNEAEVSSETDLSHDHLSDIKEGASLEVTAELKDGQRQTIRASMVE